MVTSPVILTDTPRFSQRVRALCIERNAQIKLNVPAPLNTVPPSATPYRVPIGNTCTGVVDEARPRLSPSFSPAAKHPPHISKLF